MTDIEVLRVFCGPDGAAGNALGVVRDGAAVPGDAERAALAAQLGFSETVFLDDAARGTVDIVEDEATGAAAVLLAHELGRPLDILQGAGSQLLTRPYPDGTVEVGGRVRREVP
ncbi:hypothetical protein [Streptomyces lydicus]|uniref:hypothetical protein n=1 Tax=Streptomyces lydicus TaxID=47763 RepID=UPI003798EAEF